MFKPFLTYKNILEKNNFIISILYAVIFLLACFFIMPTSAQAYVLYDDFANSVGGITPAAPYGWAGFSVGGTYNANDRIGVNSGNAYVSTTTTRRSYEFWKGVTNRTNASLVVDPIIWGNSSTDTRIYLYLLTNNATPATNYGYRAIFYGTGTAYIHKIANGTTTLLSISSFDKNANVGIRVDKILNESGTPVQVVQLIEESSGTKNILSSIVDESYTSFSGIGSGIWSARNTITRLDNLYLHNASEYTENISILSLAEDTGTITPFGPNAMQAGSSKTYQITPNEGYKIKNVIVDNISQGPISTYTFNNIIANHTIEATFERITYNITYNYNGANYENDIVIANHGDLLKNTTPTVPIRENYNFVEWNTKADGSGNRLDENTTATASMTFYAIWRGHSHSITFNSNGGSLVNTIMQPFGSSVTKPTDPTMEGHNFVGWYSDSLLTTPVTWPLIMELDKTLYAKWDIKTYQVTVLQNSNGLISYSSNVVPHGGTQSFVITPNNGYQINSITVDGVPINISNYNGDIYTFSNVTSNHSISATFILKVIPTVTTNSPNSITTNSFMANGAVINSGSSQIIENGFYWSTSLENIKQNNIHLDFATQEGAFSYSFENLIPNTKYYLQAYAKNYAGTNYGQITSVVTLPEPVQTINIDNITSTTTKLSWTPGNNGASYYRIYSGDTIVYEGTETTATISGLTKNTNYTFKIYSYNEQGNSSLISVEKTLTTKNSFNIEISYDNNGIITPNGTVTIDAGGSKTFTITPNNGYKINTIFVDGISQTITAPPGEPQLYTFTNIQNNHTISAAFKSLYPEIGLVEASNIDTTSVTVASQITNNNEYTITETGFCWSTISGDANVNSNNKIVLDSTTNENFSANITGLTPGTKYYIKAYAISDHGAGYSEEKVIETLSGGPINATATPLSATIIRLEWDLPTSGTPDHYRIYSNVDNFTEYISTPELTYNINNLTKNTTYTYRIYSVSAEGIQTKEYAEVSATTKNIHIINASSDQNGTITPSGISEVETNGDVTYTFNPNTGYHINNILIDGEEVPIAESYTFENITENHTIAVSFAINQYTITLKTSNNGTITPNDNNIYNFGDSQTFLITPNLGYHVSEVLVDGVSVGPLESYTFNEIDSNHTLEAVFALNIYTIDVIQAENGNITPSTAHVSHGNNISFSINPEYGYKIKKVIVDGNDVGSERTYTFTNVVSNRTITAEFELNTYLISTNTDGNGSFAPSSAIVQHGSSKAFSVVPKTGYHVKNIKVDGVNKGALSTYIFENVIAAHEIYADFEINTYQIETIQNENGKISPLNATISYGGTQSFNIIPNTGYHVKDVLVDGVSVGPVNKYTFYNVKDNHTIEATFEINTYDITVINEENANGTLSPAGTHQRIYGGKITISIIPNAKYFIEDVLVDGKSIGPRTSYTFSEISADHTIKAVFNTLKYPITVVAGEGGTITPGNVALDAGESQTFTITPNTDYHIVNVVIDGVAQGAITTYSFNDVHEKHTISATFAPNIPSIITVAYSHGGTISPETTEVSWGSNQTFTIVAEEYYCLENVTIDGIPMGPIETYTFENVTENHSIMATFKRFEATGGTITDVGGYRIHTFTESGSFVPNGSANVEIMVVAGGGGGGKASGTYSAGGGGAGGLIYKTAHPVQEQPYTVNVGLGGAGSQNGQNSSFDTLTAIGGGAGGNYGVGGASGGSGGGGGSSTNGGAGTPGQGYAGGGSVSINSSGGGGGAGEAGKIGPGGNGIAYSISGVSKYYAGGGGSYSSGGAGGLGGGGNGGGNPTNGLPNTGGGGGGGVGNKDGAAGGSGIVIIRYPYTPASPITMGDPYYTLGINSVVITWPYVGDNNTDALASVRYKKVSAADFPAGQSPMEMTVNREAKQFSITINNLAASTPYLVELTAVDPDNAIGIVKNLSFSTFSTLKLASPSKVSFFNPLTSEMEEKEFVVKDTFYWFRTKTNEEIAHIGIESIANNSNLDYTAMFRYPIEMSITPNIAWDASVDKVDYNWSFKLSSFSNSYTIGDNVSEMGIFIDDIEPGIYDSFWNIVTPELNMDDYNVEDGYFGKFTPEEKFNVEFYKNGTYIYYVKLTDIVVHYNDGREPETMPDKEITCKAIILQPSNFRGDRGR